MELVNEGMGWSFIQTLLLQPFMGKILAHRKSG